MSGSAGGALQNVLSISTAANNRYLLHFNSLNSLTQWTAGIRLSMYEQATLHEAYTGSLIGGKGKLLNNIRVIMERSRFKTEDWARVRFGAGTPWRRCWCVVTPPDEKEYQKAQKTLKKRHTYDRAIQVPKGDVKFYDTRKVTKRTRPIATITDAYAAYAIYPQSKPLIDQSTLVKIEGLITIHGIPETTTEGFVFIMPEVHPAVTGFEMMLRFLFPVFDTFALYGRPTRLIADTLDQRGLMFALPNDRRYGYLDILDVSGLIHTEGSQTWSERQWRKELKKLTSHRMGTDEARASGEIKEYAPRRSTQASRASLNLNRNSIKFNDDSYTQSVPTSRKGSPSPTTDNLQFGPPRRTDTAPQQGGSPSRGHQRSSSDAMAYRPTPSRLSHEPSNILDEYDEYPPEPPVHGGFLAEKKNANTLERVVSEPEPDEAYDHVGPNFEELRLQSASPALAPVASPPEFSHGPGARPLRTPYQAPELRRATSAIDAATLQQLADATTPQFERAEPDYYRSDLRQVATVANRPPRMPTDASVRNEVNRYAGNHTRKPTLATIPDTPYRSSEDTPSNQDAAPSLIPTHATGSNQSALEGSPYRPALSRGPESSHSINRKPVAGQAALSVPIQDDPPSPSSNGSFNGDLLDHAALERMLQQSPSPVHEATRSTSSEEDDTSVDYDSVKAPSPPKKPFVKPRAGRLKTVGNPDLQDQSSPVSSVDPFVLEQQEQEIRSSVPAIDFGPTRIYKPNIRPSTSGSITPGPTPRDAEVAEKESAARSPTIRPMLDGQRSSYFENRKDGEDESNQDKRRSVAWQPATTMPAENHNRTSLTPEQWVQYRASMAAQPVAQSRPTPVYSHSRQPSSNMMPTSKTPPPLSRTPSGDWSRQMGRTSKTPPLTRTASGDWTQQAIRQGPSRPHSRNASAYLNSSSPVKAVQTQASHLSAREQMHVARATGSPMLNLSNKDRKQVEESQAPGLIGAMAARERERAAIKEGMRSGMVQQAIMARQQQQQQAQAEMDAQAQAQYMAQLYAQQQQQQAQMYQYQQQQAVYQNAQGGQQQMPGGYMYGSGPGSQYTGQQMPPQSQAQSPGGGQGWAYGGVPQQQMYGAPSPYYIQDGARQQQRRY